MRISDWSSDVCSSDLMAAAGDEQAALLGGEHRRAEIDARDRPSRALADAVLVERDDDDGTAHLLLEPAGDDTDHARMPTLTRNDRHRAIALRLAQFLRRLAHQLLDCPALLVVKLQFGGEGARLLWIPGGEQP